MKYYEVKVKGQQKHITSKNLNDVWEKSRVWEYIENNYCFDFGEQIVYNGDFFQLNSDYLMSVRPKKIWNKEFHPSKFCPTRKCYLVPLYPIDENNYLCRIDGEQSLIVVEKWEIE